MASGYPFAMIVARCRRCALWSGNSLVGTFTGQGGEQKNRGVTNFGLLRGIDVSMVGWQAYMGSHAYSRGVMATMRCSRSGEPGPGNEINCGKTHLSSHVSERLQDARPR